MNPEPYTPIPITCSDIQWLRFDKFAGRPLSRIHALRDTCTSMCNANLQYERSEQFRQPA